MRGRLAMKTILLSMGLWVLGAAVGYGQIRAIEWGSPDHYERIIEDRQQLVDAKRAAEEKAAKRRAEKKKCLDSGRSLFGVDERWTEQRGGVGGTLVGKPPSGFKIGDWGCTSAQFRILDKVSSTEFLVLPKDTEAEPMLVRGLDTSKVTDGVEFILQHPVFIRETYSYPTVAGGQKTVFVLERNEEELAKKAAGIAAAAEAKRKAAEAKRKAAEAAKKRIEEAKRRTWTSDDGKYQTTAKFISMANGVVVLEKDDGKRIDAHLEQLSKEDQDFVHNRGWLNPSPPSEVGNAILVETFQSDTLIETSHAYGPSLIEGELGAALAFDGDLNDTTELTVGMWLFAADTQKTNFLFDVRKAVAPSIVRLFFSPDSGTNVALAFGTPSGEIRVPMHLLGKWHHILATWENTTLRVFFDGELVAEQDGKPAVMTPGMLGSSSTRIGSPATGFFGPRPQRENRCFHGAMDEFLLLRRALSPADVDELYQMGLDGRNLAQAP